ncbi:MAG TPA: ergothioneine biosynthesis protein EgtB [Pyrinomonadaceae bacterium]|nr:ergothioneine biosynthesis protein EgtB [Pyrinomonadaceae bacterium]
MSTVISKNTIQDLTTIQELYSSVRSRTMEIVQPLEIEDYVVQTAEFMSPPRWHIGHTTWFFETLLQKYQRDYEVYSEEYLFYFNSYYEGFGARIERPKRGTRSRPTVKQTLAFRRRVDAAMMEFLGSLQRRSDSDEIFRLVRLGLEHEMQHQELLVYDIKHLLCDEFAVQMTASPAALVKVQGMAEIEGGMFSLGFAPTIRVQEKLAGFAFDNEKPAHPVFLQNYEIDKSPVTNGAFLEFIQAGGYRDFHWWFSEGWETVNREHWEAPLYWEIHDQQWWIRDFAGLHLVESKADEPVSHVSYYEASAYAKWAGKRLPTEAEWERAATFNSGTGEKVDFPWGDAPPEVERANLHENNYWGTAPIGAFPEGQTATGCHQMIGDVWEWTSSDYTPYPGFKSDFDEYNDKWFVNQKVLRGGSFATPQLHIRATYRNFFHAHERWMVSGFRCARDSVVR